MKTHEEKTGSHWLPEGWDVRRRPDEKLRLLVLASGGGTNLQAILDACQKEEIYCEVCAVVSNKPDAYSLVRASNHDVPGLLIDHRKHASRRDHEMAILERTAPLRPHMAVLAGYMRLVTPLLLNAFKNHETGLPGVVNIHPADTRAYQGAHGYEFAMGLLPHHPDRLEKTFITVHFVDEGMDTGPVILKEPVPILPDDTLETLRTRGLAVEHRVFPEALSLLASGRVRILDNEAVIDDER